MKKFKQESYMLYVGTAREIKSFEKNLYEREIGFRVFTGDPSFNINKVYGLSVDVHTKDMTVVSADTILSMLFDL